MTTKDWQLTVDIRNVFIKYLVTDTNENHLHVRFDVTFRVTKLRILNIKAICQAKIKGVFIFADEHFVQFTKSNGHRLSSHVT